MSTQDPRVARSRSGGARLEQQARRQHPRLAERRASDRQSVRRRHSPREHVLSKTWLPPTHTRLLCPLTAALRAVLVPDAFSHHSLSYKYSKHTDEMPNVAVINERLPESSESTDDRSRSGFKLNLHCEPLF